MEMGLPPRRVVEVHRDPNPEGYRSRVVPGRGDTLTPLALPDTRIAVADLLP
jgi:hypothetical protein